MNIVITFFLKEQNIIKSLGKAYEINLKDQSFTFLWEGELRFLVREEYCLVSESIRTFLIEYRTY